MIMIISRVSMIMISIYFLDWRSPVELSNTTRNMRNNVTIDDIR